MRVRYSVPFESLAGSSRCPSRQNWSFASSDTAVRMPSMASVLPQRAMLDWPPRAQPRPSVLVPDWLE